MALLQEVPLREISTATNDLGRIRGADTYVGRSGIFHCLFYDGDDGCTLELHVLPGKGGGNVQTVAEVLADRIEAVRFVRAEAELRLVFVASGQNGLTWGVVSLDIMRKPVVLPERLLLAEAVTNLGRPWTSSQLTSVRILDDVAVAVAATCGAVWLLGPQMDPVQLNTKSAVRRWLSYVPMVGGGAGEADAIRDMLVFDWGSERMLCTVSARNMLYVWSLERKMCLLERELSAFVLSSDGVARFSNQRLAVLECSEDELLMCVHVLDAGKSQFVLLRLGRESPASPIAVELDSYRFAARGSLRDVKLTTQGLWAVWADGAAFSTLTTCGSAGTQWCEPINCSSDDLHFPDNADPVDIVVAHVFGGSFHPTVVRAALAAFCNQSITVADRQLRELASRAIRQAAIKSGGDRDAALLQGRRLLTNLEQCQGANSCESVSPHPSIVVLTRKGSISLLREADCVEALYDADRTSIADIAPVLLGTRLANPNVVARLAFLVETIETHVPLARMHQLDHDLRGRSCPLGATRRALQGLDTPLADLLASRGADVVDVIVQVLDVMASVEPSQLREGWPRWPGTTLAVATAQVVNAYYRLCRDMLLSLQALSTHAGLTRALLVRINSQVMGEASRAMLSATAMHCLCSAHASAIAQLSPTADDDSSLTRAAVQTVLAMFPGRFNFEFWLYKHREFAALKAYLDFGPDTVQNEPWRWYLVGRCLLADGRRADACDALLRAAAGLHDGSRDDKLGKILESEGEANATLPVYLCRMAELFENAQAPELAARFTRQALMHDKGNGLPSLQDQLGKKMIGLALEAGLYDDAYSALLNMPASTLEERTERRFFMHRFVNRLWHDGHLARLCGYSYGGDQSIMQDLLQVFAAEAQDVSLDDLLHSSETFYDFLYAFHVAHGDYKQAALWMIHYERRLAGERLSGADDAHSALTKRAHALCCAINALSLVPVDKQWVAISERQQSAVAQSPKRSFNADVATIREGATRVGEVQVVDVAELRRRHALVTAHLRLVAKGAPPEYIYDLTPLATFKFLVDSCLYDAAMDLASLSADTLEAPTSSTLPLEALFEDLTAKCLLLTMSDMGWDDSTMWLHAVCVFDVDRGAPVDVTLGTPADAAWTLLRSYLARADTDSTGHGYHMTVARRILREQCPLPEWLVQSIKERQLHVPLLRAYLDLSQFDAACLELLEYIDHLDRECRSLGDVSGLLPWQLVSRAIAGLTSATDIDRLKTLKKRLRERLEGCSAATWGKDGKQVLMQIAAQLN